MSLSRGELLRKSGEALLFAGLGAACSSPTPEPPPPPITPPQLEKAEPNPPSTPVTRPQPEISTHVPESTILPQVAPKTGVVPTATAEPRPVIQILPTLTSTPRIEVPTPSPISEEPKTEPKLLWDKETAIPRSTPGNSVFADEKRYFTYKSRTQIAAFNLDSGSDDPLWMWSEKEIDGFKFLMDRYDPEIMIADAISDRYWIIDKAQGPIKSINGGLNITRGTGGGGFYFNSIQDGVLNFSLLGGSTDKSFTVFDKYSANLLWRGQGQLWYTDSKSNTGVVETGHINVKDWYVTDLKTGTKRVQIFFDFPQEARVHDHKGNGSRFFSVIFFKDQHVLTHYSLDLERVRKEWELGNQKINGSKSIVAVSSYNPNWLYVAHGVRRRDSLSLVDIKYGKPLWTTETPLGDDINAVYTFSDNTGGTVILHRNDGPAIGITPDGKIWENKDIGVFSILGSYQDSIAIINRKPSGIHILNARSGKPEWSVPTQGNLGVPDIAISGRSLIVAQQGGNTVEIYDIPTQIKYLHQLKKDHRVARLLSPKKGLVLIYSSSGGEQGTLTALKI